MDCEQALEALSAALDGELSLQERQELNAHLEKCPACRALSQELSAIHDACDGLEVPPPPELKEHIMAHLPLQDPVSLSSVPPKTSARRWQRWGAMAAAFALVCLAAWQLPKFIFTQKPAVSQENTPPAASDTSVPLEAPDEDIMPSSEAGGDDTEEAAQGTGGAQDFAAAGSGVVPEDTSEDMPENAAARSQQPVEAPAETPVQGALADTAQADAGLNDGVTDDPSGAATDGPYKAQKYSGMTSAAPSPSAAPAEQAVWEAEEPPAPDPAPEASAASRSLLLAPRISTDMADAASENTAENDSLPAGAGGGSTPQLTASSPAPNAELAEPSVSLYTSEDSLASEDALTPEVPMDTDTLQPFVDTADFEKVVLTSGFLPTYCGKITLSEGQLLGDYPQEEQEDGTVWYTLPAHQFWALLQQLEESDLSYQFQPTGDHINPAAPQGLVILPQQ